MDVISEGEKTTGADKKVVVEPKCNQIEKKQTMQKHGVCREPSTNSEVSCQVTASMHQGFIMNLSGSLSTAHSDTQTSMYNIRTTCDDVTRSVSSFYRLSCCSSRKHSSALNWKPCNTFLLSKRLNNYLTLSVMLFSSITSLSRSTMTTRRLWSYVQKTSKTVMSGWLQSRRPGTSHT